MLTRSSFMLAAIALAAIACDKNDNANTDNATSANSKDAAVTTTNAPAPAPQTPPDPLANAENKDRVKQYPDEVKMAPTPGKIVTGVSTTVRESPHGTTIDTTEVGMTVMEVAKRGDYYLVLYPDPKSSGKQLAGWVYKDAVEAATWPGVTTATGKNLGTAPQAAGNAKTAEQNMKCKSGETHLRANGDFCANTCKKDDDCSKSPGGLCDGVGYDVKKDGTLDTSKMERYCVLSSANVDRETMKGDGGTTRTTR